MTALFIKVVLAGHESDLQADSENIFVIFYQCLSKVRCLDVDNILIALNVFLVLEMSMLYLPYVW